MGNSESYIIINLDSKNGTMDELPGYLKITYKRETYRLCKYYEKLTADITYHVGYRLGYYNYFNMDITEMFGSEPTIKYHPESYYDIFDKIESYFSIFHPERPLILGFGFRNFHYSQYYEYTKLKGHSFTKPPDGEFLNAEVSIKLQEQDRLVNKEIIFKEGAGHNRHIKMIPKLGEMTSYVGKSKDYKKVTYLPNTDKETSGSLLGPWELFEGNIFKIFPIDNQRQIDVIIRNLNHTKWTSVIAYYNVKDEMPLIVKIINGCQKLKFLIRQDTEGKKWKEERDKYNDDYQMAKKLNELEDEIYNKPTIYHLDKKDGRYGNIIVSGIEGDTDNYYSKYDHDPIIERGDKVSQVFINGQRFTKNKGELYEKPLLGVGAYFLKQNGQEDEKPFLIEFKEKERQGYGHLTYYYNRDGKWYETEAWPKVLDQRLEIIEEIQESHQEEPITEKPQLIADILSGIDDTSRVFIDSQSKYQTTNESKTSVADIAGGTVGGLAFAGLSGGGFYFYKHYDSVKFKI